MKKLLAIPIIVFLFCSCGKNEPSNKTLRGNSTLQYKVDGMETLYTGHAGTPNNKGVIAWKHSDAGTFQSTYYTRIKGFK